MGQGLESPVHVSSMSQLPVLARQTVSAEANWQSVQHGPAASSQTAPSRNRHVDASQQSLQVPSSSPQSQSSPSSTMPFPHSPAVMVGTLSLSTRQLVSTSPDPIMEQTLPTVQDENSVCEVVKNGFIRYCPSALHVDEESWQHCPPEEHAFVSQS